MVREIWDWAATPGSAALFGIAGVVFLCIMRCHREPDGRISRRRISASLLLSAAFYTITLALFGQWVLKIPLSSVIKDNFGDERVAWVLLFLVADVFARYWELFDTTPPVPAAPASNPQPQ
jgi:predicted permease